MKQLIRFVAILALGVTVMQSCKKDDELPNAEPDFNMSTETALVGEEVYFENISVNALEYTWDFGDGGTSNDTNATHIYNQPGIYKVTLLANGANGGVQSEIKDIKVVNKDLTGKWILRAAFYNNEPFSQASGYFNILSDSTYESLLEIGQQYASAQSEYIQFNDSIKCKMPTTVLYDGESVLGSKGEFRTNIDMDTVNMDKYGKTAIGYAPKILWEDVADSLIITSVDSKTVLKYTLEQQ